MLAFNCHTAALASGGLSLLVPFFGGDDDIAALLLALAIMERDSSAELVILSFLEPEKSSTQQGARGDENGTGSGTGNSIAIGTGASGGTGAEAAASNDQRTVSRLELILIGSSDG